MGSLEFQKHSRINPSFLDFPPTTCSLLGAWGRLGGEGPSPFCPFPELYKGSPGSSTLSGWSVAADCLYRRAFVNLWADCALIKRRAYVSLQSLRSSGYLLRVEGREALTSWVIVLLLLFSFVWRKLVFLSHVVTASWQLWHCSSKYSLMVSGLTICCCQSRAFPLQSVQRKMLLYTAAFPFPSGGDWSLVSPAMSLNLCLLHLQ